MDSQIRNQKLKRVAGVVVLIAALLGLAAYGFLHFHPKSGASPEGSDLAVAAGPLPGSALYSVDRNTDTLVPITVPVSGKDLPALDAQEGPDGSWYFILNEMGPKPVTNLYVRAKDGSVKKLTTSQTAKYNLSYDAESGKLIYQVAIDPSDPSFLVSPNWNLTVYDPSTGNEQVVGTGVNPVLLPGGGSFLYAQGGGLVLGSVGSDATSSVISIPSGIYAVDTADGKLAIYNDVTRKIDLYALTNGASPSYLSSLDTNAEPEAMGYVSGILISATTGKQSDAGKYIFSHPDVGGLNPILVTALPNGVPQRLYAYE